MSNWTLLNQNRCTKPERTVPAEYVSTPADGFNGMFRLKIGSHTVRCVASDGGGWQHVSVSLEYETHTPDWATMSKVKELFWEDEDWVTQYHPAKSCHVNFHPWTLHLWCYTGGGPFQVPTPHALMVGPKRGQQF